MTRPPPRVGLIMGSQSDWATLRHAAAVLDELGIAHETGSSPPIARPSAWSPTPAARARAGSQVIIAGAGGAAHLPGMVAAMTAAAGARRAGRRAARCSGLDSLLSIVQMPAGVPVGTLAIGRAGAVNAALLAAAILALQDAALARARWRAWRAAPDRGRAPSAQPSHGRGRRREARARRLHRHPRRRPARPHDRARRRPARLSLPRVRARAGQPGRAGHQPRDRRRL